VERAWETFFDDAIGETVKQAKQIPVLINYTSGGKRSEKKPDTFDLALIKKIEDTDFATHYPVDAMPDGFNTRQPRLSHGITHVHHFYQKRSLMILSTLRQAIHASQLQRQLSFLINSYDLTHSTLMTRIIFKNQGKKPVLTGNQSGTLYVSSLPVEKNILAGIQTQKLPIIVQSLACVNAHNPVSTASAFDLSLSGCVLDYIFIDPPFGANLNYSELNYLCESWLQVKTNNKTEIIENDVQGKTLDDYRFLMKRCFAEAFRMLKPGRWMTVEFSNTKASVWNSIQTALTEAGFIVANVSALDKKQRSFKAVTTPTAVKQDLVISAYKPNGGFEERFQREAQTEEGVWEFIRTHLKYLPVTKQQEALLLFVPERDPRILYDQMVAYYVRKGYPVPLNSAEFQEGLSQRFSYRDGMYFLPDQVAEYDRKKMTAGGMEQMSLFVSDESSAIAWLRQLLKGKPQTFQDIHPQFLKEIGGWQKHEKPLELSELLEQNFLRYDGKGEVPNQIHSYLSTNFKDLRNLPKDDESLRTKGKDRWYVPDPNKASDLEKLRERSLLKEFEDYRTSSQKRLKVFRLEAVRAGFKKAWQDRDYVTIITVARKVPENVLQEDPKLLMWYDQALTRSGENG